jgi:hypothetical protein
MTAPEQLTLPLTLPNNRQTFYPFEVMELLSVGHDQLRGFAEDGTLTAINIAREGCRPTLRYTRESVEKFIRERNTRNNPL